MSEPNTQQRPPRMFTLEEAEDKWLPYAELAQMCEKQRLTAFQADAFFECALAGGDTRTFAARRSCSHRTARDTVERVFARLKHLARFNERRSVYYREILACMKARPSGEAPTPLVGLLPMVDPDNCESPEAAMRLLRDSGNYRTVGMRGPIAAVDDLPHPDPEAFLQVAPTHSAFAVAGYIG